MQALHCHTNHVKRQGHRCGGAQQASKSHEEGHKCRRSIVTQMMLRTAIAGTQLISHSHEQPRMQWEALNMFPQPTKSQVV